MATVSAAPGLPRSKYYMDASPLSTIRDPRSPVDVFPSPQHSGASTPHPDLTMEVETLSNKLISAINHQTTLDDALNATRLELDTTQEQVKRLEAENMEHERKLSAGELMTRADLEARIAGIAAGLAEEKRLRALAEKDKKAIEQELENLTTALFEEANEMVAAARKEKEASDHRNEQLQLQLKETQSLLASQQEQLAELKSVMQQLNIERAEQDAATASSTAPSTPALPSSHADIGKAVAAMHTSSTASLEDISPAPPTSFTHLLSPILRTDLTTYEDFRSLIDISRRSTPSSRVNSGSFSNVHNFANANQPSNGSVPGAYAPQNNSSSMSPTLIPLKETKFYKRALTEDIEPTLRLDTAPGLSWLVRRSVINSMGEGSLVVEPMPASTKMFVFSCALCGEHRRGEEFQRAHRFRTSESESAQRYPLCGYCLNRVRATCDYLSFLRMVKDGHWRADGPEGEKAAWEESVRLRERMFWARIGGGVVPAFNHHRDSPRPSTEGSKPPTPYSAPAAIFRVPSNESAATAKDTERRTQVNGHDMAVDNEDLQSPTALGGIPRNTGNGSQSQLDGSPQHLEGDPQNSLNKNLLKSLAPKPRSRAATHELERTRSSGHSNNHPNNPSSQRSMTPSPSPSNRKNGDQGLQISIPGGFNF